MSDLPLVPTTMVGSYPRPGWFTHQLAGRDIWDAFKQRAHQDAFEDAVRTILRDQELAGLDVLTDGQMWFDDYVGGIGSFVWYRFERIPGFEPFKRPHPQALAGRAVRGQRPQFALDCAIRDMRDVESQVDLWTT